MEMGNSLSPSSTQRGSVEAFAHPDPQIQRWWRPASHLYADWMIDEEGISPRPLWLRPPLVCSGAV